MREINLLKYNRHWEKGFKYPYPKKRKIFSKLTDLLFTRQIIQIVGLRRVGKTTLFFQLINHLIEKKIDPFLIWYFTFDEEKLPLDELFWNFSKQTQKDFKKEKIFVFLDEIQKLPNFQNQLKIYYDLYPNLKFFISGSTSLFIKKRSQESLAGRVKEFFLPPLDFEEYLYFKDKKEILKKKKLFESEIEKEFEIFLESQFIESIEMKREEKREYYLSIIKKIIFEDLSQIFPVDYPEVLFSLVKIISQRPGMLLDYQTLSQKMNISHKTLSNYLFFLQESFLLKKIYNFSKSLLVSERKLKKFYLASPSFSWALSDFLKKEFLVENFLLSIKNFNFFWRDPYQHEIDFVALQNGEIIPIEVKYKKEITRKDLKNLVLFLKKFKLKKGILYGKFLDSKKEKIKQFEIFLKPIYFV